MTCQHCGRPMRPRTVRAADAPGTVRAHTAYICEPCRTDLAATSTRRSVHETAAEVAWLLGTDHPDNIARRLGYAGWDSLNRVLLRGGYADLAHHVKGAA